MVYQFRGSDRSEKMICLPVPLIPGGRARTVSYFLSLLPPGRLARVCGFRCFCCWTPHQDTRDELSPN